MSPNLSLEFNELIYSLENLSKDHRLSRVFSQSSSEACDLTLWLLEVEQEYRLLYSWIIPRPTRELNSWLPSYSLFKDKKFGSQYKFHMHRLTFQHSGHTIFNLIKKLCMGITLEAACKQLALNVPNKHKQFSFAKSSRKLPELFAVRPTIFIKHASSYWAQVDILRPISGPNEVVPAFLGSLVRLKKLEIFQKIDGLQANQSNELSKHCLLKLATETGFDFCGVDSKRLGNLEWLCFPAADHHEKSKVKIYFDSPAYTVTIDIPSDTFSKDTQITIRCCLFNGREVSLDHIKTVSTQEPNRSASFTSQQKITNYLITIWLGGKDTKGGEIWYEHSGSILEGINWNVGLGGRKGNIVSDWLKEASKNKKISTQVEQAQNIEQIHYEKQRSIKKYEHSPWLSEGQKIYELVSRLFLPSSGSLFIRNGWHQEEEPGIFTFFKWLQSKTDDNDINKALIVDPYFDVSGIKEVIARVTSAQAEYVVITNTQTGSSYPKDKTADREPERASRLKEACKAPGIDLLLSGLKFNLLDLRSSNETHKQLFHDRYILFYNRNDEIRNGYHLSNSIQGATKNHPLLITEIPYDTLTEVDKYIEELQNPLDKQSCIITLFSSGSEATDTTTKLLIEDNFKHLVILFSELLQNEHILSLSKEELQIYFEKHDTLKIESGYFEFKDINAAKTQSHLQKFTQTLVVSKLEKFIQMWTGLCIWLNQIRDGDKCLSIITTFGGIRLTDQLLKMLDELPNKSSLFSSSLGSEDDLKAIMLTDAVSLDFSVAIREASDLIRRQNCEIISLSIYGNGIRYATKVLSTLAPEKLASTITKLQQRHLQISQDEMQTLQNFKHTLSFVLQQVINEVFFEMQEFKGTGENDLLLTLLKSDTPAIRAISAYSMIWEADNKSEPSIAFSALSVLSQTEQLYVLAEWIFKLRIKASFQEANGLYEYNKSHQLAIFSQMIRYFPQGFSDEDFINIVGRLSGPLKGNNSASITEHFLIPLIENKQLSIKTVTDFWLSFLVSRLKNYIQEEKTEAEMVEEKCEFELIEVGIWSILNSDSERRNSYIAEITKLTRKAQGILFQPFLKYRNHQYWTKASLCIIWLMLFQNTLLKRNTNTDIADSIRIFQPSESLNDLLDATFENDHRSYALTKRSQCCEENVESVKLSKMNWRMTGTNSWRDIS